MIDAVDSPAPAFAPPNVSIHTGDTVRFEFDAATTTHTVTSTSANWTVNETRDPNSAPISRTFDTAGTYTFLCSVHTGMSGSITVADAPANTLAKVLVFSKTAGFRHDSIPQGIAAIQALGTANGFTVDATEDAAQFTDANLAQYDVVVFLSTTGDVLNDAQQTAFEHYIQAGGGYVGIHAASDTEYTWPWYGQMLGGYFRNHPAGTPTATVHVEDANEPSTTGLPASWSRVDEWYNFQPPTNPVVNGGGNDYSPRDSGVHVLATVDESTYGEDDGNTADDDHPVAWCTNFDGGRAWYTAMGHTQASFSEPEFRAHILGGLRTAAGTVTADCGAARQAPPAASDFEIPALDDDTKSPMELAVAKDGRVFYVERITGEVNVIKPDGTVADRGRDPGLERAGERPPRHRPGPELRRQPQPLRRVHAAAGLLDRDADLALHAQRRHARPGLGEGHLPDAATSARSAATRPARWPSASTAASTCRPATTRTRSPPTASTRSTSAPPTAPSGMPSARRPTRTATAARSCASSRSRTRPARASARATRSRTGNLFPEAADTQNKTLPEIFAMGFRNPFRITVDPMSGKVLMGDYGPDAGDEPEPRPAGQRSSTTSSRRATTAGRTASATTSRTTTTTSRPAPPGRSSTARRRSTTRPTTRA